MAKTRLNIDKSGMKTVLMNFASQMREAISIGETAPLLPTPLVDVRHLIFGMGGSAIGGDLLRSYLAVTPGADKLMISVHRSYLAPGWLDSDCNVFCSSYSGDTEETLSAYDSARKVTRRMICITTGGSLTARAQKSRVPVVSIPAGLQPRCALAYSFFPILLILMRSGAIDKKGIGSINTAMLETTSRIDELSKVYMDDSARNPALQFAKKLEGSIPIIYSANDRTDAVASRWRGQIQENAKQVAWSNVLPEMSHNEINGWQNPKNLTKACSVILLRDSADHKRVALRFNILQDLIKKNVKAVHTVEGLGTTLLSRMFTMLYFGDWVSYYLAILNNTDPTPVPVIQTLKSRLAPSGD